MSIDQNHRSFLTRALASGLAAVYLLTNVAASHATESAFWGERRRVARARFQPTAGETPSRPLYTQLPKNVTAVPDLSAVLEHATPQTAVIVADLGKAVAQTTDRRILDAAQAILPYGNIRFVRESITPGAPLILHIQDVHGNLEAQKNMAEMMLALARDHGVQLAGLEGATGAFATDEFKPYPDQEAVKKVAAYFMKKDILGGPEYAALASEKPIILWGIEDPALYQANEKAVKESLAGRTEAETFLVSLTGALDPLKQTHYTEDLKSFDKNQTLYDQGLRGLGEYLQALSKFNGQKDAVFSFKFPNVSRLLSAFREEKYLNFAVVERERQALVEKLVEKLTQAELQDLVRRSVDLRGGKTSHNAYHGYLRGLCERNGLSLSRYPSLTAYMHYVAASEDIDREDLLKEMASLEKSAQDALIKTAEQRKFVDLSRDTARLKILLANEMTPDEWTAYKARQREIANLPARVEEMAPNVPIRWPEKLAKFLSPFESFCARAMERDAALTGRLLEKMTQEKQSVAVLVAGGFHTDGLMDTLVKQGASVAVLTPKIGQVDPNHRYLDAFAQDPLPLEKIFNGEPISMKTECPLGESSSSGVALREEIHLGIVLSVLNKIRLKLNSSGNNLRDTKKALVNSIEELKENVKALAWMPLSVETVTPQGVTINVGDGTGKSLATAMGEATEVSVTPAKPNLLGDALASPTLREELRIAWTEKTGFLSPVIYFWSHPQWVGYQKWIGRLLILGLWLVMGETAMAVVNLLSNMDLSLGDLSHSPISMSVGLLAGFFATLPAHAGWNLFAEKTNAVFNQLGIHFGLPRLTVNNENGRNIPAQFQLLTPERRRRNEDIAKLTKGRFRVLYLMAGFDLNNALTTWPDASEVIMLGNKYINFNADRIRNAMQSETLLNEVGPYKEDVLKHGNGDSLVLEEEQWQISILALELKSLGVDPSSIEDSGSGGLIFSYIDSNQTSRKVEVTFTNAYLGPKEDSEDLGQPAPIDLGQGKFDGVYFKAGYHFGGNISPILEQVASNLAPEVTLVLTNNLNPFTPRAPEASDVAISGFTSNFQASFQSSGAPYANTFNVYTIHGNKIFHVVDQSDEEQGPITDPAVLEAERALNGFDISRVTHGVLNGAVRSLNALGKIEPMRQFPRISHVLEKLLPFSVVSSGREIAPPLHSPVPQVISWRADNPADPVDAKSELKRELSSVLLGGVPGTVWIGFNGLERRYEINLQQPQNVRDFRFFLRETFSLIADIPRNFPFSRNIKPESEVHMREAVDLARSNSGFRNALAHWALAEMLLASSGRLGWLTLDYWKARELERRILGEMAKRNGAARMQRAAQAVALLRAAGASLSAPSHVDGNTENQSRDIEILISASGASCLSPGNTIERPYNDVLRGVGIQDLWRGVAESHRGVSFDSASKALSVSSTVYFNVDVLLDRGANARVVAGALRGQLQARVQAADKNRLVLITSKPDLLRSWGAQTEAELVSRWAIEWSRSYGTGFLSITGFALLHEGSSGVQEKLISSVDVVDLRGKSTSVRSIRLAALQTHSKQMGSSVFELWTDDPHRVDTGTIAANCVVDILKVAEAFEKAMAIVRFLAIAA